MRFRITFFLCLLGTLAVAPGLAIGAEASSSEIEAIRTDMEAARADYEARMQRLEERLARLEGAPVDTVASESGPDDVVATSSGDEATGPADTTPAVLVSDASKVEPSDRRIFDNRITETRVRAVRISESRVLADRAEEVLENFVSFNGYFRAGYGKNDTGGTQVGFKAPGAFAKYRLGNEAETYGELGLTKNWFNPGVYSLSQSEEPDWGQAGPLATFVMMFSFFNPYEDTLSGSATDVALPQTWAGVANVIPSQPEATFWAGNRFYRRHDIHLNDFFFYNMSGGGGGIEGFDPGHGKMALAWIGNGSRSGFSDLPEPDPVNKAGFSKGNWDLRWYDVKVPFGRAEFGLTYATTDAGLDSEGNSIDSSDGWAINVIHTREDFLRPDGMNKLSLQYGRGAARTFTSGFETYTVDGDSYIRPELDDSWRFRVTENFVVDFSESFSFSPVFVYQYTDYGKDQGTQQWVSAGIRPVWNLNDYVSIAFEGGIDWVDDEETGLTGSLTKLTLAPQIAMARGFNTRPVIRAFVTWATWSDDFIGHVGGLDYLNESDGLTFGMQMETWW